MILITKTSDQTRQRGHALSCVCVAIPFIVCVCMCLLNCTQPRNPALSPQSFFAPRIDPSKEGSVILIPKTSDQTRQRGGVCVFVCMCVLIALYITAQSGPDILVTLSYSH